MVSQHTGQLKTDFFVLFYNITAFIYNYNIELHFFNQIVQQREIYREKGQGKFFILTETSQSPYHSKEVDALNTVSHPEIHNLAQLTSTIHEMQCENKSMIYKTIDLQTNKIYKQNASKIQSTQLLKVKVVSLEANVCQCV